MHGITRRSDWSKYSMEKLLLQLRNKLYLLHWRWKTESRLLWWLLFSLCEAAFPYTTIGEVIHSCNTSLNKVNGKTVLIPYFNSAPNFHALWVSDPMIFSDFFDFFLADFWYISFKKFVCLYWSVKCGKRKMLIKRWFVFVTD